MLEWMLELGTKRHGLAREREREGERERESFGLRERERDRRYIYIYCEVIIWSKFGLLRGHYLVQGGVIIWSKLFSHYKNGGFRRFCFAQLSFCVFFVLNHLAAF